MKLTIKQAVGVVEDWLNTNVLSTAEKEEGFVSKVCTYGEDRPLAQCFVSEVDFCRPNGGSSYMQVDFPIGMAICCQVERCLLALVEDWGEETDQEFERLRFVFSELENKEADDGEEKNASE